MHGEYTETRGETYIQKVSNRVTVTAILFRFSAKILAENAKRVKFTLHVLPCKTIIHPNYGQLYISCLNVI